MGKMQENYGQTAQLAVFLHKKQLDSEKLG